MLPIRCIAAVVRHHAHMDSGRRFALQLRGLKGGVNGPAQAVELQAVGSAEERRLQCERWTRAIMALVCAAALGSRLPAARRWGRRPVPLPPRLLSGGFVRAGETAISASVIRKAPASQEAR